MLCEDTHGNKFLVKAIKNSDRPWISEEVICLFVFFHMRVAIFIGLFQNKSPPPRRKACWKISWEVGINGSGNPDGGGL